MAPRLGCLVRGEAAGCGVCWSVLCAWVVKTGVSVARGLQRQTAGGADVGVHI